MSKAKPVACKYGKISIKSYAINAGGFNVAPSGKTGAWKVQNSLDVSSCQKHVESERKKIFKRLDKALEGDEVNAPYKSAYLQVVDDASEAALAFFMSLASRQDCNFTWLKSPGIYCESKEFRGLSFDSLFCKLVDYCQAGLSPTRDSSPHDSKTCIDVLQVSKKDATKNIFDLFFFSQGVESPSKCKTIPVIDVDEETSTVSIGSELANYVTTESFKVAWQIIKRTMDWEKKFVKNSLNIDPENFVGSFVKCRHSKYGTFYGKVRSHSLPKLGQNSILFEEFLKPNAYQYSRKMYLSGFLPCQHQANICLLFDKNEARVEFPNWRSVNVSAADYKNGRIEGVSICLTPDSSVGDITGAYPQQRFELSVTPVFGIDGTPIPVKSGERKTVSANTAEIAHLDDIISSFVIYVAEM